MGSYAEPSFVYLLGLGVGHSIAPPVHNYIASSLGCPWTFEARDCTSVEGAVALMRHPTFAGAVITMPYKKSIMPYLDEVDNLAAKLGACNLVSILPGGRLRGTNTDWIGVAACLSEASSPGEHRPSLIIGAGGACKASLYALTAVLKSKTIYILNRDEDEVLELEKEVKSKYTDVELVHVKDPEQAKTLSPPFHVVGTIPDAEPVSLNEKQVHRSLEVFLQSEQKGIVLDMCYKPRRTRILRLSEQHGWKSIEGTAIIGHQFKEQYRLWCGEDLVKRLPLAGAWDVLHKVAESSAAINY
ncbi:hypothetical protein RBB50_009263 [Rhinocladiella similis]